jgi:1,4-alpha-glucan branching enzyme
VFAFLRRSPQHPAQPPLVCVFNCTPVPRPDYWLGVPEAGMYRKVLDTDAPGYGGAGYNGQQHVATHAETCQGYPNHIRVNLPPLGALFFEREA